MNHRSLALPHLRVQLPSPQVKPIRVIHAPPLRVLVQPVRLFLLLEILFKLLHQFSLPELVLLVELVLHLFLVVAIAGAVSEHEEVLGGWYVWGWEVVPAYSYALERTTLRSWRSFETSSSMLVVARFLVDFLFWVQSAVGRERSLQILHLILIGELDFV